MKGITLTVPKLSRNKAILMSNIDFSIFFPPAWCHAGRVPVCHHQVCGHTRWGPHHHFRLTARRETQLFGVSMCHFERKKMNS